MFCKTLPAMGRATVEKLQCHKLRVLFRLLCGTSWLYLIPIGRCWYRYTYGHWIYWERKWCIVECEKETDDFHTWQVTNEFMTGNYDNPIVLWASVRIVERQYELYNPIRRHEFRSIFHSLSVCLHHSDSYIMIPTVLKFRPVLYMFPAIKVHWVFISCWFCTKSTMNIWTGENFSKSSELKHNLDESITHNNEE